MEIERIDINDSEEKQFWFRDLVQTAYDNGWTYSSCTDDIWKDYVERWNHFVEYLEYMRAYFKGDTLKILIGEAPPFYRKIVEKRNRSYFYDPKETKYTPWFGALYKKFVLTGDEEKSKSSKENKLEELALKGVLLIDLFPFPIIQSTEVRMEVSGNFSGWIEEYFMPFLVAVLNYLAFERTETKFEFGMAATKYAATQFLLGTNVRKILLGEPSLLGLPIKNPGFLPTMQFHEGCEVIKGEILFLPIYVKKKDGSFDLNKYNDYFEFVVTIVYSEDWLNYNGDSVTRFVKDKITNENVFLLELNDKLGKRNLLPIYSADSVMISLEEGVFFNSK